MTGLSTISAVFNICDLLIFQAFQDVRMASSLVRSTIQTLGIPRVFAFFGVVGFGWNDWLRRSYLLYFEHGIISATKQHTKQWTKGHTYVENDLVFCNSGGRRGHPDDGA